MRHSLDLAVESWVCGEGWLSITEFLVLGFSAQDPLSDLLSGSHFTSTAHPQEFLLVKGVQQRIRAKSVLIKCYRFQALSSLEDLILALLEV